MAFAENDGTRIFWRETGSGDPLLLIMGLGYTCDMWHHIEPTLAQHYRVILFDNRGVGRSDVPPGPYLMTSMAADAAAVLDAAGVASAHVFGISMGGYIAQEFALQYPARVRSLVLGCTSCGGQQAVLARPEVLAILEARKTMQPEEGAWAMVPYIYDSSTPQERIEADIAIRMRTYPAPEGYDGQLQGIFMWESHSRLSRLNVPTLVLHGVNDQLVPPENGHILARAIPGARLEMIANASHIFFTDQPQKTCELVHSFLSETSKSSQSA